MQLTDMQIRTISQPRNPLQNELEYDTSKRSATAPSDQWVDMRVCATVCRLFDIYRHPIAGVVMEVDTMNGRN